MTMRGALRRIVDQGSFAAWVVAVPSACLALTVTCLGTLLVRTPTPDALRAEAGTFDVALRSFGAEHAYAFVRQGVDINAPLDVVDPPLTGDQRVLVTPLVLAVAAQNENTMLMLLNAGARLDDPGNAWATCVASWVGREDLRQALETYGGARSPMPCPAQVTGPVLAFFAR